MNQAKESLKIEEENVNTDFPFLLPGQPIPIDTSQKYNSLIFQQSSQNVSSYYAGYPILKTIKHQPTLNIQKFAIQYLPSKNQIVIGKIKVRTADSFIVDLFAPMDGNLGVLQFDGATKRNKPNLQQGDLVYTRVLEYSKYIGAKLSCLNKGITTKKVGNQLGALKGGSICHIPAYKHTKMIEYFQKIGKCVKFEIAMGKNGIVWINTARNQNIMLIINILKFIGNQNQLSSQQKEQILSKMLSLLK